MELFSKLVKESDTVIEVGGHIGYITQYFSHLVGESGKVICFEPGINNQKYILENLKSFQNVILEKKAVGNEDGFATFYEDNATGQNNSLLSKYPTAESTAKAHLVTLHLRENEVEIIKIDSWVAKHHISPNFIKIDVEGYDLFALIGALKTLKTLRAIMIEVTYDYLEIEKILLEFFSYMWDQEGNPISRIPPDYIGNIFASKENILF